jgi:hypothetical protein
MIVNMVDSSFQTSLFETISEDALNQIVVNTKTEVSVIAKVTEIFCTARDQGKKTGFDGFTYLNISTICKRLVFAGNTDLPARIANHVKPDLLRDNMFENISHWRHEAALQSTSTPVVTPARMTGESEVKAFEIEGLARSPKRVQTSIRRSLLPQLNGNVQAEKLNQLVEQHKEPITHKSPLLSTRGAQANPVIETPDQEENCCNTWCVIS